MNLELNVQEIHRKSTRSMGQVVFLVDQEQRIFQIGHKTYCYSAEVFARMLNLPCGGEDMTEMMKKVDVSIHFKTIFEGATGYIVEEFHNFGGPEMEKEVVNLMKTWNDILLLPRYTKYCSKGTVVAAMSYVEGRMPDLPGYKSNFLHKCFLGKGTRQWGYFNAIVNFHNKMSSPLLRADLNATGLLQLPDFIIDSQQQSNFVAIDQQAHLNTTGLLQLPDFITGSQEQFNFLAIEQQPDLLDLREAQQQADFIATSTGDIFDVRCRIHDRCDFIANSTGYTFDLRVKHDDVTVNVMGEFFNPLAPDFTANAVCEVFNPLAIVEYKIPILKVHAKTNQGLHMHVTHFEDIEEEASDDNEKVHCEDKVHFIASADGLIEVVDASPYPRRILDSAVDCQQEQMATKMDFKSGADEVSSIVTTLVEGGRFSLVSEVPPMMALSDFDEVDSRYEVDYYDEEMEESSADHGSTILLESSTSVQHEKVRSFGPETNSSLDIVSKLNHPFQLPTLDDLEGVLACTKITIEYRLIMEAALAEELEQSKHLTKARLIQEEALRVVLEGMRTSTQNRLNHEAALEKQLRDSREITTKQKVHEAELQTTRDLLASKIRRLEQKQKNFETASARLQLKRKRLELEMNELEQGMMKAAKMAELQMMVCDL